MLPQTCPDVPSSQVPAPSAFSFVEYTSSSRMNSRTADQACAAAAAAAIFRGGCVGDLSASTTSRNAPFESAGGVQEARPRLLRFLRVRKFGRQAVSGFQFSVFSCFGGSLTSTALPFRKVPCRSRRLLKIVCCRSNRFSTVPVPPALPRAACVLSSVLRRQLPGPSWEYQAFWWAPLPQTQSYRRHTSGASAPRVSRVRAAGAAVF